MIRDSNFFIIIVKAIAISFISFSSLINTLIKIKIFRFNKIYLYKNNNKEKYLR